MVNVAARVRIAFRNDPPRCEGLGEACCVARRLYGIRSRLSLAAACALEQRRGE
jgi:hypothetical protein